ncbi:alpha/beta-hydrolase [Conidiobolus coronatus NRRL 28638]|uniref:Alpha/beta-hydrolase n=1 Tax=Conidiobolus coronatus (strain ATCC 28846 / CBS 209.66 / NRRL 28638) TaxID=796925 RepID=A0A137PBK5_CONC2|nr:alpha/beta-hydrolase [Conidiobolus coronatus NRRL 28638]|eukprot:KXN72384.1 alpha/beta-hydrolase [Conidiobolus coronatus NRRL 28638]
MRIGFDLLTRNEPHSIHWPKSINIVTKIVKALFNTLGEYGLEEMQFLSSISKFFPPQNLVVKTKTVPSLFRGKAHDYMKSGFLNKYGEYPQPEESHWSKAKPLEYIWVKSQQFKNSPMKSVILYIHGGAYCLGHPANYNSIYETLSSQSQSDVIGIDYRKGPQCTLTGMIEDVIACYFYITSPESEGGLGIAPSNVVVGGDSAGGGLTSNLCHILKNFGGEQPAGIFLWSGSIDLTFTQPSRLENSSVDILPNVIYPPPTIGNGYKLDTGEFIFMYKQADSKVQNRIEKDGMALGPKYMYQYPEITPIFDSDMSNLPTTLIVTGDRDGFRDLSIVYGKRRAETEKKTGINRYKLPNVQTIIYEDMPHIFMVMPEERCKQALELTGEFIDQVLSISNNKSSQEKYTYLPSNDQAYRESKYNMYWNDINGKLKPWESPYKVTSFPNGEHLATED